MGFLIPWFLLGLAAIGLPVYIHLLRRHMTTPLPFSSLMFFERGTQSSTRHRRLRYLLLFSLRARCCCCWCWHLPILLSGGRRRGNGKLLLMVVDDSFSMKAGSRFAMPSKRHFSCWHRGHGRSVPRSWPWAGGWQF